MDTLIFECYFVFRRNWVPSYLIWCKMLSRTNIKFRHNKHTKVQDNNILSKLTWNVFHDFKIFFKYFSYLVSVWNLTNIKIRHNRHSDAQNNDLLSKLTCIVFRKRRIIFKYFPNYVPLRNLRNKSYFSFNIWNITTTKLSSTNYN